MAGLAALFDRGGTVDRDDFDAVFDALSHRGWDGADAAVRDRVALGHHHSYTTPEEVGEEQPISHDGLWLAMDGRVDNREAVLAGLADAGAPASAGASDAELVLRAYRAWGDALLDRLVGAFAFALWDPADERLLVARDRTGIRKVYYADTGDAVVVASEMSAVLEHPAVSGAINEGFVGELLSSYFYTYGDTFYEEIYPVEAGSVLDVTAGETRTASYWEAWNADVDPDPRRDHAEEFLARLEEAVACRLRAPALPGVQMSGGLDSTTVAGVARRYLDRTGRPDEVLHSFSLTMDGDFFEAERERIDAAVEAFRLAPHAVRADDHYALKDVEPYERAASESPVYSPVVLPSVALYGQAVAAGRNVLLTGGAGNLYDGSMLYYLDLVRRGKLATFVRHARASSMPFGQLVLWYVLAQLSERVGEFVLKRAGRDDPDVPPWVATDFAERCGLAERVSREIETGVEGAEKEQLFKRYFRRARAFEDAVQRRIALRSGVEVRHPYLDSRLLSFMLTLPPGVLRKADHDKHLFRRATRGVLPEVVRTQDAAVTFNSIVETGVFDERREYVEDLFADSRLVELGVVDEAAYEAHVEEFFDRGVGQRAVWDLITMELWLRQRT